MGSYSENIGKVLSHFPHLYITAVKNTRNCCSYDDIFLYRAVPVACLLLLRPHELSQQILVLNRLLFQTSGGFVSPHIAPVYD